MLHAVVPVKGLEQAKGRLAPVLSTAERRELVLAMLGDVLRALHATPAVDAVTVISRDTTVLACASEHGAQPLHDHALTLNGALTAAAKHVAAAGARTLLVLPADLPLVTARDLTALVAALGRAPGVVLAASRDGGTNALLMRPPLALPFQFGVGSLELHAAAARERGLRVQIARSPALALDVDQPDDLARLADAEGTTAAQQFARALPVLRAGCCTISGA